jgi:hypothetical protein
LGLNDKTLKHIKMESRHGMLSGRLMLKRPLTGLVVGLCLAGFGVVNDAAATPIVIDNASFETLPPGGFTGFFESAAWTLASIPGWSNSGMSSGQATLAGYSGNPAPSDGLYMAFSDSESISQVVASAVAGTTYTLQVDVLHRADGVGNGAMVSLTFGGVAVATGTGTDNLGAWNNWSATYTATAADAGKDVAIVLGNSGMGGQGNFDNVRLDASAVPEPAAVSLLGIGGLAMAGGRFAGRRKRESVA